LFCCYDAFNVSLCFTIDQNKWFCSLDDYAKVFKLINVGQFKFPANTIDPSGGSSADPGDSKEQFKRRAIYFQRELFLVLESCSHLGVDIKA